MSITEQNTNPCHCPDQTAYVKRCGGTTLPSVVNDHLEAENNNEAKGGFKAWIYVLASFFLFMNAWGLTQTFGAFNQYYVSSLLSTSSPSSISWIGSFQVCLVIVLGVFTGPLFDAGYLRQMLTLGSTLVVLGMSTLSLATAYWQVFLAQGLCVGLGSGLLYVPALAFVSTLFPDSVRPWAIGCVNAGGGMGGIIYTFMLRDLEPHIGFGWAVRAIALVTLVLSVVALAILLPYRSKAPKSKHRRAMFDLKALREPSFLLFSIAMFLNYLAFYITPFYIPMYATEALHQSRSFAFACLVYMSITSIIGRTLPMLAAGRLGSLQVYIAATVGTIVALFSWTAVHNVAVSGVQVAAPSAAMSHPVLSPTMSVIGTRMGMGWMFAGVGVLVGSPIAGALVNVTPGQVDFKPAQSFAGAVAAGALLCLIFPLVAVIKHDKKTA
ncbi:MFS monocarboxylate transporter [Trichophyton equinum CBS 127.97]|uniref:MFS monocarboxylate transporter n=1 Tax=Trichophyton equinum (strain ATCC MYA-4606 / CBS 127.97) TaxID=559882 RepID=F2PIS1_TRIEC|nr:MFS monocarboxylate transporter [Trichophyton equinum CBS 127.97]